MLCLLLSLAACERKSDLAAVAAASAGPIEPWQPADRNFDGCAGG